MTYSELTKAKAKLAKINHDLDEMWENAETEELRAECMKLEKEAEELQAIVAEGNDQFENVDDNDDEDDDAEALKAIEAILAKEPVEKEITLPDSEPVEAEAEAEAPKPKKERKLRATKEAEPELVEAEGFSLGQKAGWVPKGREKEHVVGTITKLTRCYARITDASGKNTRIAYRYVTALE